MSIDNTQLEQLVEVITKQVLIALNDPAAAAKPIEAAAPAGPDPVDHVRRVVDAGATRIAAHLGTAPDDADLAHYIDHTLLKPEATDAQIAQLCYEARKFNFAAVCVNPSKVKLCAQLLRDAPVKIATVVGFPLGATQPEVKAYETQQAIDDGATEIDMVINIGAMKSKDYALVARDIATVVYTAQTGGAITKVIIEAALLNDEEKVIACKVAKGSRGRIRQDVYRLRLGRCHRPRCRVDALGRSGRRWASKRRAASARSEDAVKMIEAGATRIGASASVKIMQEANK